jgi:RimJ/RimL family protein N-acetyltransferase
VSNGDATSPRLRLERLEHEELEQVSNGSLERRQLADGYATEFSARRAAWILSRTEMPGWPNAGPFGFYLAIRLEDNVVVGNVNYTSRSKQEDTVEISGATATSLRRQGYASEAVDLLLQLLAKEGAIRSVVAEVANDNIPAIQLAKAHLGLVGNDGSTHHFERILTPPD